MPPFDLRSGFRDIGLPALAIAEAIGTQGRSPGTIALGAQQQLLQREAMEKQEAEAMRQRAMQERLLGLKIAESEGAAGQREAMQRQLEEENKKLIQAFGDPSVSEGLSPEQRALLEAGDITTFRKTLTRPTIGTMVKTEREIAEIEKEQKKQETELKKELERTKSGLRQHEKEQERKFKIEQRDLEKADKTIVKTTNAQEAAALYGKRMEQAHQIFDDLEREGVDLAAAGTGISRKAPSVLKGAVGRRISQAERNFVNAVLRRESGAVISDAEFANAEQQYFTRFRDDPDTIEQKKQNRLLAIEGLKSAAGPAWEKFGVGGVKKPEVPSIPGAQPIVAPAPQIDSVTTINTEAEYNALRPGATYIDASDGQTYIKGQ